MTNEPKIAIIGAGAVGGILGAHLAHAGHYVVFCDILKDHLDAIKQQGLTITGVSEITVKCARIAYSISELANFPEVDTLIISTKASALPHLIPEIEKVAPSGTRFICNQNGLDNEEFLAETFGPDNILRLIPNYAGDRIGDGKIWMSFFNPPNYIGAMTDKGLSLAHQLAEIMSQAGLHTQFSTNIKRHEWVKAILNAAMSSVCALTRKTMKDIMDSDLTEWLVGQRLREGIAVAEACGITFEEEFLERSMTYLKKAGHHKPSMLQDVERGTPTEIDWIDGKIVEWGRVHGVETPCTLTVLALLKGLEMESGAPQEY